VRRRSVILKIGDIGRKRKISGEVKSAGIAASPLDPPDLLEKTSLAAKVAGAADCGAHNYFINDNKRIYFVQNPIATAPKPLNFRFDSTGPLA
jgi:hypothetical protein